MPDPEYIPHTVTCVFKGHRIEQELRNNRDDAFEWAMTRNPDFTIVIEVGDTRTMHPPGGQYMEVGHEHDPAY